MSSEGKYSPEMYREMVVERTNFSTESWETFTPEEKLSHFERLLSYGDLIATLGDERTERANGTVFNKYSASTNENEDILFFGSTTSGYFSKRNREFLQEEADVLLSKLREINGNEQESAQERYKKFDTYIRERYSELAKRYIDVLPFKHPESVNVAFFPSGTESELFGIMVAKGMNPKGPVINTYFPYAGTSTGAEAKGEYGNLKNWTGTVKESGTPITGMEVNGWLEISTSDRDGITHVVDEYFEKFSKRDPKPTVIVHYMPGNKLGQDTGDIAYYAFAAKNYNLDVVLTIDGAQGRISERKMVDLIEGNARSFEIQNYIKYKKAKFPDTVFDQKELEKEAAQEISSLIDCFAFSPTKSYGVVPFAGIVYYEDTAKEYLEAYLAKTKGLNEDMSFYVTSHMFPGVEAAKPPLKDEVPNIPLLLKLGAGIRNVEDFQHISAADRRLIYGSLSYAATSKLAATKGFKLFSDANAYMPLEREENDLDTVVVFSVEGPDGNNLTKKELDFLHQMLAKGEVPEPTIPTTQALSEFYRKSLLIGAPVETKTGEAYMRLSFSAVDAIEIKARAQNIMSGTGIKYNEALSEAISEKIADVAVALNMVQNAVKIYGGINLNDTRLG